MRTLSALLVVLLLCPLQLTCSGNLGTNTPVGCCSDFFKEKIPLRRIKYYSHTRSDCPLRAVVFHTLAGRNLCADPETPWVKGHMKKLNLRS